MWVRALNFPVDRSERRLRLLKGKAKAVGGVRHLTVLIARCSSQDRRLAVAAVPKGDADAAEQRDTAGDDWNDEVDLGPLFFREGGRSQGWRDGPGGGLGGGRGGCWGCRWG